MQNNFSKTRYLALLFPHTQLSAFSFFCLFLPPKRRSTLYRSPTHKTQLNGSTFSPKHRPPLVLLSHKSTAPLSPAPPFSNSTFVGATHLSLTTISPPLSPLVLLSHNPIDTWFSTTGFVVGFYPYQIFIFIFGS